MNNQNPSSTWSLWEKLCGYTDVILTITTEFMSPAELIHMYSISKDFHFLVDSHRSKFIKSSAGQWATLWPIALEPQDGSDCEEPNPFVTSPATRQSKFEMMSHFPYTIYTSLCHSDPTGNYSVHLQYKHVRKVPSLRYLLFLEYRCNTIKSIINELALIGLRLPRSIPAVLAKIWLLMDVPTNKYRLALIHNTTHWTDDDLRLATLFFIKLDMAFQDPASDEGRAVLRHLVLAQRSLSVLCKILRREEARTALELSRLFIRWKYRPSLEHQYHTILGVPPEEIGKLELEGWGLSNYNWGSRRPVDVLGYLRAQRPANEEQSQTSGQSQLLHTNTHSAPTAAAAGRERQILLRPDQLVMREGLLRNLKIDTLLMQMMRWGYVDHKTCKDYPPPGPGAV